MKKSAFTEVRIVTAIKKQQSGVAKTDRIKETLTRLAVHFLSGVAPLHSF